MRSQRICDIIADVSGAGVSLGKLTYAAS
uniref:Uncharacterized protein n=1 Tax=Anguilla anguilla TaxID=7936 RepID=A0A0E9UQA5_ANGAN